MKIILLILALLVWLCMTRVGARVEFGGDSLTVAARVGLIRFRVYPKAPKRDAAGEKTPKQMEKEAKAKAAREAKQAEKAAKKQTKAKPELKQIADMVRSALQELLPPLKRALARLGRGIRIKPLRLYVTLGAAEDPAAGAQLYGELNAAVWAVMPVLEEFADVPDPYLQVDVDFDAPKTDLRGEVGVSLRIGTLLAAAFGIGVPAVRWYLRMQKKKKQQLSAASAAADERVG